MSQAAGGSSSEDVEQALAYLELLWGDEFMTGHDEKGYWAARRGQIGCFSRADGAEELGKWMTGEGAGQ